MIRKARAGIAYGCAQRSRLIETTDALRPFALFAHRGSKACGSRSRQLCLSHSLVAAGQP